MSSVVDWSEINPELFDLIIKRLDLIEFIRAGAVCQSWYSITSTSRYISPPKSHSPWLILSSPHQPEFRYVSNPADPKSLYKFNLPNMKHDYIVGSSHGFIISIDEIAQVHATNPITGSHKLLPAITTLPCCEGAIRDPITNQIYSYFIRVSPNHVHRRRPPYDFDVDRIQKYFYHKVALFPTSSAGLISVLVHNFFEELAFASQSDESWTFIQSPIMNFEDVLFYKGLLYAVNRKGCLVAFDILNLSASSIPVIYGEGLPESCGSCYAGKYLVQSPCGSCYAGKYLVQSPCGSDLFLIARFFEFMTHLEDDDGFVPKQTVRFKVYKLNQDDRQWNKVSSFGTDPVVVFLGLSPSVMLLAKDIPNIAVNKGDCIYFTEDDLFMVVSHKKQKKIFDMGIFYMEDNKINSTILHHFGLHLSINRDDNYMALVETSLRFKLYSGAWEC